MLIKIAASPPIRAAGAERVLSRINAADLGSLLALLALVLLYLICSLLLPAGGFYIGDQGVKFAQIEALARTASLGVGDPSEPLSVYRPAFANPGVFYFQVGDHYQSIFSPAYAVTVAPFYRSFGMWGLVLPSIAGAALAAHAAGRLAALVGRRQTWPVVIAVGLGSPVMFYALVLWEHALSTGLLTLACYLALRRSVLLAGVTCGLAIWLRPESYLFALALGVAGLLAFGLREGLRLGVRFSLGFVAGALPWWTYNVLTVNSPLGLSGQDAFARTDVMIALRMGDPFLDRLSQVALYLIPIGIKKWGLLLVTIVVLAVILHRLHLSARPALWLLWLGATVIALVQLLGGTTIVTVHSIVDGFPFALAALVPAAVLTQDRRLRFLWIAGGVFLVATLLMTVVDPLNRPTGWGPRYLLPVFSILAVLAWSGFELAKPRLERAILAVLFGFSLIVQIAGLVHLSWEGQRWARLNGEIEDLQPKVVATAVWWVPQIATPTFTDTKWYGVVDVADLDHLAARTERFWWLWTSADPRGHPERVLQTSGTLPDTRFARVETRRLSTEGLAAVLYRVVRPQ